MINKISDYIKVKNKYISNIINLKKKYKISFSRKNKNKLLELYDDNNNKILTGKYHFYGIYQKSTKLWIWASSIPGIDRIYIDAIDKIKSYSYMFESSDDTRMNFYYQLLTQDVIYISDINLLTWINELLIYLYKDLIYFNPTNSQGNIQFIGLTNIIEKYY
jgi:hypothetical protein